MSMFFSSSSSIISIASPSFPFSISLEVADKVWIDISLVSDRWYNFFFNDSSYSYSYYIDTVYYITDKGLKSLGEKAQ